jgi:hypothetical protein
MNDAEAYIYIHIYIYMQIYRKLSEYELQINLIFTLLRK